MFDRQLDGSIFDFIELIAVEEQVKVENHQMSVRVGNKKIGNDMRLETRSHVLMACMIRRFPVI